MFRMIPMQKDKGQLKSFALALAKLFFALKKTKILEHNLYKL